MTALRKYVPHYTFDDYRTWEGDGELWDGIAVSMSPSPFGMHQALAARLARLLGNELERVNCNANVSHEMRTPLTSILGLAELIQDGSLDGAQQRYIRQLHGAASTLQTLVNDLLDLAQIEAGKVTIAESPFALPELMKEIARDYGPAAREQGLALRLQIAEGTPQTLVSDRARLRQVLNNLVDNAIKFTSSGEVTMEVSPAPGQPDWVACSVIDTGCGISPADQRIVFNSFSQCGSGDRLRTGVGLGLAIAKRLTQALGGQLQLTSTVGRGSSFTVLLPVGGAATQLDRRPAESAASGDEEDVSSPGRLRVLVAEDNPVNRKFMTHILARDGHDVAEAENGKQVLEMLARDAFDILLMDCQMPEVSGYDAARAIREREQVTGGHLPIVAVTAHAMTVNEQRCREAGMDLFLSKPFRTKQLYSVIARAARLRRDPTNTPPHDPSGHGKPA